MGYWIGLARTQPLLMPQGAPTEEPLSNVGECTGPSGMLLGLLCHLTSSDGTGATLPSVQGNRHQRTADDQLPLLAGCHHGAERKGFRLADKNIWHLIYYKVQLDCGKVRN